MVKLIEERASELRKALFHPKSKKKKKKLNGGEQERFSSPHIFVTSCVESTHCFSHYRFHENRAQLFRDTLFKGFDMNEAAESAAPGYQLILFAI